MPASPAIAIRRKPMSEQKPILEYGKPPKKRRPFAAVAFRFGLVCLTVTVFFALMGLGGSANRNFLTSAGLVGILTVAVFAVAFVLFLLV